MWERAPDHSCFATQTFVTQKSTLTSCISLGHSGDVAEFNQRRRVSGQIYLLQCQDNTVSIFTSPLRREVGLAHSSGVLGTLHGPPRHSRAGFRALPAGRWRTDPTSPHKHASDGLTVLPKQFPCNRAAQLSRMSCIFTRDACQKNLLMFLFQWRAWRQPGLANRSYSLHRIHATAVCGVLRALQGCVAEGQRGPCRVRHSHLCNMLLRQPSRAEFIIVGFCQVK